MIKKVIEAHLLADSEVVAGLSTYVFVTGSPAEPAIFTRDIPKDAGSPSISMDITTSITFGTRDSRGGETEVDVGVWANKTHSDKNLQELAMKVFRSLDRAKLDMNADGYEEWGCQAEPPISVSDSEEFPGYVIRVRARFIEV